MLVESQSGMPVPNARPRGVNKVERPEPRFSFPQEKSNGGVQFWPRPRSDVKSGGVRCQSGVVV